MICGSSKQIVKLNYFFYHIKQENNPLSNKWIQNAYWKVWIILWDLGNWSNYV